MTGVYKNLLSPFQLGSVRLKNRIIFRPHRTNLAHSGRVSETLTAYYQARANGGCGAVIVGEISYHPGDRPYEKMIEAYTPAGVDDLKRLAETLKSAGAAVFAQVNHRGFQSHGAISRLPTWGPVPVSDVVYGEVCRKMGPEEIREVSDSLAQGAEALKEAGFDGIEIGMGSDSLLRQFLSPLTNTRDDDYGGDLAGRLRFPLEIIRAVRDAVGPNYPVGPVFCLDEMFYGALDREEALQAAMRLQESGLVDFFCTTVGTYYNLHLVRASMHHSRGFNLDLAASLKEKVSLPVAVGNRITTPETAEEALYSKRADMISWRRPLICDPDLPKKIQEGRESEITACVYDNQSCIGRTNRDRSIGCIQNPWTGRESKKPKDQKADKRKKVVVVGAGPAGLEAAYCAALRGHNVLIFEEQDEPGGQARLAGLQPGRSELGDMVGRMTVRLERIGAPIFYGREMDAASIMAQEPDAVILALGSFPNPAPVPGIYGPPEVLTVRDVLEEKYPVGKNVLLIDEDGHYKAALTAVFIADRGSRVEMVTSELFIGLDLAPQGDLNFIRGQLDSRGVAIHCDQLVTAINGTVVETINKHTGAARKWSGYDAVVAAMGQVPNDSLYKELKAMGLNVMRAGDCVAPRRIDSAVREGAFAGLEV